MKSKRSLKYEKGTALIIALFFVMILTVAGMSLLLNTSLDNVVSNNYSKTVRATYTATSGIERFKAYLLYDYKHDPAGWSNRYLVVPQGSTYVDGTPAPSAAGIGGTGSDAYFDLGTDPSTIPYRVDANIPYADESSLYAALAAGPGNPIVTPGSGYHLMIRNVPATRGGTCNAAANCDPDSIYLMAMGRTTATKAYLNAESRGMNLIEDGIFGDDISVWNNIFFATDNDLSGGGAMTIHGNVHTLGPAAPPLVDDIVFDTLAEVVNTYYMGPGQGNLEDPIKSTLSATQQRNSANINDVINNLGAKFRVRNGLVNLQGSASIGTAGMPFDVIATCRTCPNGNSNGFTDASPDIHGQKITTYNVPANLQSLIKVPLVGDQYKDPATNIIYPSYTDYFIGMATFGGNSFNYPGAMGLKLATALGSDSTMTFDVSSGLAAQVWAAKAAIFSNNVNNAEQRPLDPLTGETTINPLFTPNIGIGPTDGKTFMIVAADTAKNVVIVYKEVAPFQRPIDPDPTNGLGSTSTMSFPRVIHGFVWAPHGTDMTTLALKVDIDGDDVDGDVNWIFDTTDACHGASPGPHCNVTLTPAQSNQLVRRVVNSLWRAGRGECGVLGPCYSGLTSGGVSANDFWEPSMTYAGPSSRIYVTAAGATQNMLKITPTSPEDTGNPAQARKGKLIAYGAIETTDTVTLGNGSGGSSNGVIYAGRFTLYARDSNTGGSGVGLVSFADNAYPISSYQYPTGSNPATYVAFPCQNNMGIMTTNDIDHSISPHDEFAGAFYAEDIIHLTAQEQIVGAMVASGWDFANGGNPDFYQAMEISRCLPPYIIAKDPIVYADSQSWLER